ncbi:fungal-specific transcription factor domain-containing protein [Dactylonectria estremocensis]|uniref:Fungal-specific transcription factor domain-containing protein n=1 Tax=Dactylonectria estremocensis TaxID=1079267 RepID=A0A9P9EBA3_9HYPO|nr:fungal-specific transcription factor domain-containing protein [Dactylonectria estremocensis]
MAAVHSSAYDVGIPTTAPPVNALNSTPYEAALSQQQTPPHHHLHQTPTQGHTPALHHQSQQQQSQQQRSVKRPRPVKSCTECRKRKLRCDRLCPCSQCQKSSRSCKYAMDHDSANLSDGSDSELVESSRPTKRNCLPGMFTSTTPLPNNESTHGSVRNGEATALSSLEELAMRMERLEKHLMGRSPAASEASAGRLLAASSDTIRGLTVKQGGARTRYHGQNNSRVLFNLFDEAKDFVGNNQNHGGVRDVMANFKKFHKALLGEYRKSLSPITVFVDSMMPVQKRMTDILPKKIVCDRLVKSYVDTSETIYRILHLPTFTEQYERYWDGTLQSDYFLPQLLAVLSVASRFETKSKGLGNERAEGVHIPTACALVRTWLDSLRGKQLVEFATLQIEVLLLHAQRMITPRMQDSWTSLGSTVRMAMTMGLHRDPSEFEPRVPVFIGEMRRRLWFTILDMDLHISLASNLPCLVRDGDFTCQPPRNLDDSELYAEMKELPPSRPIDQATDNQMQVYAAMTLGVRMKVAHLLNRIDTIRDYQEVLDVGAKLGRYLDDINYIFPRQGILSDAQKSKQWRTRVILDMHVRRPLLALYRPFAIGAPDAPAQISRQYLSSSMVIMKYLDELDPMLAHFQDVAEMYHQVLKNDIIQAALSVCFFIRAAVRPSSDSTGLGTQALRMSPDSSDDYPTYSANNVILWSLPRLIDTVEKTLDLLIRNMSGRDTKDIVCLAIVLQCVMNPDPKPDEIIQALRINLDHCLMASNMSLDNIAAAPPGPPADGFQGDTYMHPHMPFMYQRNNVGVPPMVNDFGSWILWEGWD